jgi:hypothetical protein
LQFRYRGSRRESAVAQLFSLGHFTTPHMKPKLRDIEFCLLGIGSGIFIGFSIAERSHTFMEDWGWAVGVSALLAGSVVGAVRERQLRKTLKDENPVA